MQTLLIAAAVVGVIGFSIFRQVKGEPLRGKRVILLPVILLVIGLSSLAGTHHLEPLDVTLIATSSAIAALIGIGQGFVLRLESRNGALWGQMPVRGLWLWAGLIASRVVISVIAFSLHAHIASSTDSMLLVLGINRLAQAGVIVARAVSARIPFAPEKDGRTFMPELFGSMGAR